MFKKTAITTLLHLTLLFGTPAYSQEQDYNLELENLWNDYVSCSVYFELASDAMLKSNQPKKHRRLGEISDDCLRIAYAIASGPRKKEMTIKVLGASLKAVKKQMLKDINNRYENFVVLSSKYNDKCIECLKKPDPIVTKALEDFLKQSK